MLDPMSAVHAREHHNGLIERLREIAMMDRVVALEIIQEVTADLGSLHLEIILQLLKSKLNEKPTVAALIVKMGPECMWEIDGFLDRDGHPHPVPIVDPNVPASETEEAWWELIEGYIGVLYEIPPDGRFITEAVLPTGPRLIIRPAGPTPPPSPPAPAGP